MSDKSQDIRNEIPSARILEGEWPLCIVAGERHSLVTLLIKVCLTFLVLPIILILVGWIDGNLVLPGPAVGLLEDWNILAMFIVFPTVVLLLVLAVRRYNEFVKRLVILIDEEGIKQRGETVAEIRSIYTDIIPRSGFWRALRVILICAGALFVVFNAFNRYYRFSELYAPGFWTSSEYPLSFWITNLYTVMVWGYILPIISFNLIILLVLIARIVGKLENAFKLTLSSDYA